MFIRKCLGWLRSNLFCSYVRCRVSKYNDMTNLPNPWQSICWYCLLSIYTTTLTIIIDTDTTKNNHFEYHNKYKQLFKTKFYIELSKPRGTATMVVFVPTLKLLWAHARHFAEDHNIIKCILYDDIKYIHTNIHLYVYIYIYILSSFRNRYKTQSLIINTLEPFQCIICSVM